MKLVVFGLSISSSWGNGHATTYRSLLKAFADRGHQITFYEWDAPWYGGAHRDLMSPDFCDLVLYGSWDTAGAAAIATAREADAVIVGSYVNAGARVVDSLVAAGVEPLYFYDIDTPITVAALRAGGSDYLRTDQVPLFRRYLSFTGGPFLQEVLERELGATEALPLYCSVDPDRYAAAAPDPRLQADLAYMGTFALDRQPVVEKFLNAPARLLPERSFLVAGPQYPDDLAWPKNVCRIEHLAPGDHSAYYSSARWQLNATRADMVAAGWSPSVRLFEAGACGAAIISDQWPGIEEFFTPGEEILLPRSTREVVEILTDTPEHERVEMGDAIRRRVMREHTAEKRAAELEEYLTSGASGNSPVAAGSGQSGFDAPRPP
jgi:spore maturation protein CgeB